MMYIPPVHLTVRVVANTMIKLRKEASGYYWILREMIGTAERGKIMCSGNRDTMEVVLIYQTVSGSNLLPTVP